MGNLDAIGYGFASFFSIWQVCILQITPFFLAYVTGLYFAAGSLKAETSLGGRVVLPALSFAPGFAVVYALLTVTGLPIGRVLVYNLGTLGFIAGSYILLASLSLVLSGRFAVFGYLRRPLVLAGVSLVLGSAFALTYSPCITPELSEILGMAGRPETVVRGGVLAFFYALGICLALTVTGAALVYLLARVGVVGRHPGMAKNACGLVLAILASLNLSGTMIYYKAFFLGFLVG
jgi:cytochrome c-type biogenesis protein